MKHPSNNDLFAYWNKQRGERLAPSRADIEPTDIRHVLGDAFVLSVLFGVVNLLLSLPGGLVWLASGGRKAADEAEKAQH